MSNLTWYAEIDGEQIKKEIRQINQRMKTFTKDVKTQGSQVDSTFKRIGAAMAGYFSITAAKGFLDQVIQVRGEFQQLDIALQTMLQSKSKADKLMSEVVQMAAKTPFSLTELGQGAKRLLAFKEPADEVVGTLRRLGDMAAGASVPVTDLIQAYGKVSAKGKMQAEELNQFAERGIPIISELAKVVGATDQEIYKMAEQGQIGFKELQAAIQNMTSEGGQFFNLMEKQSGSLTGQISNLGDAWDRMLNEVGENNEGAIYAGIGGLKTLVENYETVIDILKVLIATYGAYRAALALGAIARHSANVLESVRVWGSLVKQIRTARDAQAAFNLVTKANPWGLLAAAVAGLVAYLTLFNDEQKESIDLTKEATEQFGKEKQSAETLFEQLKQTNSGTEKRAKLLKEINTQYGTNLQNLQDEKEFLNQIEEARQGVIDGLKEEMILKAERARIEDNLSRQQAQKGFILMTENEIENLEQLGSEAGAKAARKRLEAQKQTLLNLQAELKQITKETAGQLEDLFGSEDGNEGGGGNATPFDIEAFEKQLKEQKSAYEEYFDALRSARDEDTQAIKDHNSQLLEQGENLEKFLLNQLERYSNNVAAKMAVYQMATAEGVNLDPRKFVPKKAVGRNLKPEKLTYDINTKELKDADGILARMQTKLKAIAENDTQKMGEGFIDVAYTLQDVGRNVSQFDEGLGSALGTMADLSGYAGQLMTSFASGNIMGSISGAVGLATSLVGMFSNAEAKQEAAARAAENFRRELELQNRELQRQIELMNEASGEERFKEESEALTLINSQIEDLNKRAAGLDVKVSMDVAGAEFDETLANVDNVTGLIEALEGSNNIQDLIQWFTDRGWQVDNYDELLEIIDSYDELIVKQRELMEGIVGTSSNEIADSIIEGFRQGEKAAEAFSQSFEDMMKDALMETFKKQYVMQASGVFFDEIAAAMDPKTSPGLTVGEIERLQGSWNDTISQLEGQFEGFDQISKNIFGEGLGESVSGANDASSLSGAVKGVSEETASLIGGQMNAIRVNQAESLRIMNESVRYQSEIAANTRYNHHLEGIHSEIKSLNSRNKNSDPLKAKGL